MHQGDKDVQLNIHCCWIFELAELESITGRKDASTLKNLITPDQIFLVSLTEGNLTASKTQHFYGLG